MEANVLASLARGERIPCYSHFPKEGPPQEPLPPVAQSRPQSVRVRTISGMNELLLAQLQHPIPLGRVASSPSRALVEGRPPLPRPPPSTPLAFASATTQHLGSDQSQHQSKPNQMPMAAEDDLALSPEDDHKMSTHAGGDADDALLQGEDLLDGLVADLEVSDDDSENDSIPTAAAKPKAEVPAAAAKGGHNGGGIKKVSHIRRNTAGTVHVKGTMEKPDIDGTIHVVCGVIRAHIEQSLVHNKSAQSPSTVHVNLDIFRDDYEGGNKRKNSSSMPTLQEIKAFYREFYQRSQMEFDAIIMSLIYVERLIKETNGALMPTPENWGSVVFSCMILASKVWDDLSMWNIDFSNVSVNSGVLSSFSLKRINQLELAVLVCLNFAVTIPGSEYAKYYYLLRNMMIRGGLLDPFAAHKPLSKDEKDRLEDRTNHYQDSKLNTDEIPRRRQARSVDWSVLSGGSDGADFQLLSAAGQGSYRPEIVAGPVLRENVCLEQLIPMSATRS